MAVDSNDFARMLVDMNVPRSEIVRLSVGMTPAKILDILKRMNVVELMMAMQKLRSRRTPSNQAHVTNVKDTPRPAGGRRRRGGIPRLQRDGDHRRHWTVRADERPRAAGRRPDRPPRHAVTVRGRGSAGAEHGHAGADALRRDRLRLRHRPGVRRRRRHAVVKVVPGFGLRLARAEDALHLGHGIRSADGLCRRQVHAVPGNPLHHGDQGRGRPGIAERLHQLHRRAGCGAVGAFAPSWPRTWRRS